MWKPQGMYADFLLNQPLIFQGEHAINGLATMPGAKVSVIHGASLKDSYKEQIRKVLKKKALYFIERKWNGEPDLDSLSEIIGALEIQQPDVIVAIGGGAVIDTAKLCRLYYEYPSFEVGTTRIGQLLFSTRFVAIPTTIGSGAECSSAAVYVNNVKKCKEMIVSHDLQPEVVVLDPRYVSGAPLGIVIASGIDAIAHIIEGYVSTFNNILVDINAENGLRILIKELLKGSIDNMDFERLQYAGYLGGLVQNHCIVGAAHGIAHQLTLDGYSHGQSVALLLPYVILANCMDDEVRIRYEKLCSCIDIPCVDELINKLKILLKVSGIIEKKADIIGLLEIKIQDDEFINNIVADQGAKGNPVAIDRAYLEKILGFMKL